MTRRLIKSGSGNVMPSKLRPHIYLQFSRQRGGRLCSRLSWTPALPAKPPSWAAAWSSKDTTSKGEVLPSNKSICWLTKMEKYLREGREACVRVPTYFAHVFSMMEGFERRWLLCFFSSGQTWKPDKENITTQDHKKCSSQVSFVQLL